MRCYILKEKKAKTSLFVLLSVRFSLPLTSSKATSKKVAAFIEFFFVCYYILDTNINH